MRITIRLIVSIIIAVALVAGVFSYFNIQSERKRLTSEIEHRAWLIAEGLKDTVSTLIPKGPSKKLDNLVEKISTNKSVLGIVVYDPAGAIFSASKDLSNKLPEDLPLIFEKFEDGNGKGSYEKIASAKMYLFAVPLYSEDNVRIGTLAIFNNASYVNDYLKKIWHRNFLRLLISAFFISIITVLVVRWNVTGPIAKMAEWMKSVKNGEDNIPPKFPKEDLFAPISQEISSITKNLARARAAAEEEAKLRQQGESIWTAERLKEHVHSKIGDKKFIVVSNREPYMHVRRGRNIECIRPASGLITALEPVLRASGGLWVAHGAGDADRDTVNKNNIIKVPPDAPTYDMKRVWLSQEEEEGFYYGYSNEGLWPLCHIAHTRPVFRANDWAQYQEANLKFARSIEEETNKNAYIFIQDYHFAILPRIIKNKRPLAKVALFWHIPWPNPEAFGICPQKREIIHGMLGADLIGFHTQFHCNNFLETVDRTLECRTDWEHFSVTRGNHTTLVKPYPISIDFNFATQENEKISKESLLRNLGTSAKIMGIGVDRIDYTKGIIERFRAIERFLEKYPEYLGLFTFVELGAPSREHLKRYLDHAGEVAAEAERINWKFKSKNWKPIIFLKKHFSHAEILPYYKAADICMVTALHDGMNLVAKEFIASREDENGALILSTFAGASRELRDALLVNPYDSEQMADMIKFGLEMDKNEQGLRMKKMRTVVKEHNVFAWAANIITELSQISSEYKAL